MLTFRTSEALTGAQFVQIRGQNVEKTPRHVHLSELSCRGVLTVSILVDSQFVENRTQNSEKESQSFSLFLEQVRRLSLSVIQLTFSRFEHRNPRGRAAPRSPRTVSKTGSTKVNRRQEEPSLEHEKGDSVSRRDGWRKETSINRSSGRFASSHHVRHLQDRFFAVTTRRHLPRLHSSQQRSCPRLQDATNGLMPVEQRGWPRRPGLDSRQKVRFPSVYFRLFRACFLRMRKSPSLEHVDIPPIGKHSAYGSTALPLPPPFHVPQDISLPWRRSLEASAVLAGPAFGPAGKGTYSGSIVEGYFLIHFR